ncbi:MAG: aminopeptidase P N-terminal domain-containing protein [Planctomycetota bacterium]
MSRDVHLDPDLHRTRRQRLLNVLGDGVLVVPTATHATRNGDVQHEFRPGSDFHFLTGFPEPEALLVARRLDRKSHHAMLFVRERNREREIWDGPRYGTKGAVKSFGLDEARSVESFWSVLPELVDPSDRLFCTLGLDESFDRNLLGSYRKHAALHRRRLLARHPAIVDPKPELDRLRLIKDRQEVALLRRAAEITCAGHRAAMRGMAAGMHEYEAQALLEAEFRAAGSPRNGYPSIVASGPNACVLHYHENSRRTRRGDLMLIDAGAEHLGVTADVTRTWPVDGTFRPPQAAVYNVVLRAQLAGIRACKVGAPWDAAHHACMRELTRGLVELGVLRGKLPALLKAHACRPWYMHGTSHWLGRDVHDVGGYTDELGAPEPLLAGCMLTVEPGLYFGVRDRSVPKELRGIGVRIEDDVLVTKRGPEVLTEAVPKTVAEIEQLMQQS